MLWLLALAALAGSPPPITFSSEVRPATPRIGDTFEIHVSATWRPPVIRVVPALEQWPGPFEVVRVDVSQPSATDGSESRTWIVRLRTFDRGRVTIPAIPFDYQETGAAAPGRVEVRSFDLEIGVPVVDEKGTIRPPKPPIEPRRTAIDLTLVASEIGLLVLSAGWVAWLTRLLLRTRRRARASRPFDRASAARQLEASFPTTEAEHDRFYTTVSTLTRRSLEDAFKIPATVLSSTEIAAALVDRPAPAGQNQSLRHTLAFVDIVRFGGRRPTPEENRVVLERTRRLLLRRA